MSHAERTADGSLRIRGACPAPAGTTFVWPVAVPGARIILVAERHGEARRFDARTVEAVGDPRRPWYLWPYGCAAATVPDGRTIFVAAGEDGIARFEVLSGAAYPPTAGEQPFTIWDVATARLPGGQVIIAGAGHDSLVYRWDAATGQPVGKPLAGHRSSVKAVTTAASAGGRQVIISGCENGDVRRWDAATGAQIAGPLPGTLDAISHLAVVGLPGGRQILACVDTYALHRWDLATGEPLGSPAVIGKWGELVATHADSQGTPTAFLWLPGEGDGEDAAERVEQWRLDTDARIDVHLPVTLRAVFDDPGRTWIVLGEPDGSLVIRLLARAGSSGLEKGMPFT